jgi:hypothetical protein
MSTEDGRVRIKGKSTRILKAQKFTLIGDEGDDMHNAAVLSHGGQTPVHIRVRISYIAVSRHGNVEIRVEPIQKEDCTGVIK